MSAAFTISFAAPSAPRGAVPSRAGCATPSRAALLLLRCPLRPDPSLPLGAVVSLPDTCGRALARRARCRDSRLLVRLRPRARVQPAIAFRSRAPDLRAPAPLPAAPAPPCCAPLAPHPPADRFTLRNESKTSGACSRAAPSASSTRPARRGPPGRHHDSSRGFSRIWRAASPTTGVPSTTTRDRRPRRMPRARAVVAGDTRSSTHGASRARRADRRGKTTTVASRRAQSALRRVRSLS